MNQIPKISVIIPVYNRHDTIRRAVDSIPEYSDLEVIISDDASSGSFDYLKKDYPKIKIVRSETNGGAGVARNRGMDIATGDWITFLDSDDVFFPNAFDIFRENIRPYNIIAGDIERSNYNDKEIFNSPIFLVHGLFLRRNFLKKNNIKFHPDIRIGEDCYFSYLAYYFAKDSVLRLGYVTYRYCINRKSTTEILKKSNWNFCLKQGVLQRLSILLDISESDYGNFKKYYKTTTKKEDDFINFSHRIIPKKKLSIIVPLYNSHQYIKKTLDNLYDVMSDYQGQFEVICTDDASENPDYAYLKKYPDLIIINNTQRKYMGCNRNRGLRYAEGEFVLFLDADDLLNVDGIEKFFQMDTAGYNALFFGINTLYGDTKNFIGISELCIHGDIYRTNFLRKYDIRFSEYIKASEDTYLHRRVISTADYYNISDTILYFPDICLCSWVYRQNSTFNRTRNFSYNEIFLYDAILGDIMVYQFPDGYDFIKLKKHLLFEVYVHTKTTIKSKEYGQYKKQNIKILMAVSVLLYEKMNTTIEIPELQDEEIYQIIKNAPFKCNKNQKEILLKIFEKIDKTGELSICSQ